MSKSKPSVVLPHALPTALFAQLKDRNCVLASTSPRRKEILEKFGFAPEIVGSTFAEDFHPDSFEDVHEYPVATATQKAVEVYERLVRSNPDDAPDMVIGADTVVFTHAQPAISSTSYAALDGARQELLEKPKDKADQLRMLLDLNGAVCEVVTGVTVVYPILTSPGYEIKSIDERTLVHFCDSPRTLIEAYIESGEGLDRAGGFAAQGLGGMLIRKIDGDYHNVVGFPAASFFQLLELMMEEDGDFLTL